MPNIIFKEGRFITNSERMKKSLDYFTNKTKSFYINNMFIMDKILSNNKSNIKRLLNYILGRKINNLYNYKIIIQLDSDYLKVGDICTTNIGSRWIVTNVTVGYVIICNLMPMEDIKDSIIHAIIPIASSYME